MTRSKRPARAKVEYKTYCRIVTAKTIPALEKGISNELGRNTGWGDNPQIQVDLQGVPGYRNGVYMQMLIVSERHGLSSLRLRHRRISRVSVSKRKKKASK